MNNSPSTSPRLQRTTTSTYRSGVARALLCLSLFLAGNGRAQDEDFSIQFETIGGGGDAGSNEEFSLSAGIASIEAGPSSNDEFSAEGGFWSIVAAVRPPTLTILSPGPGLVMISWSPNTDYVLQESSSLGPANWVDSPSEGTNFVTIAITGDVKFYRLRSR